MTGLSPASMALDGSEPARPRRSATPSRRTFVGGLAAGFAGIGGVVAVGGAAAAAPAPLPGETGRSLNKVTAVGKVAYDQFTVKIQGDPARIFIPQSITPGVGQPVRVVWFFHGSGSNHTALDGGFKADAERAIDAGLIAICQNDGGTLYSNPTAQSLQVAGHQYMTGLFSVVGNILRATSGGGALGSYTYAARLIPNIVGLYMVNAIYDLRAIYDMGGNQSASVGMAFNNDTAAIDAANAARYPQSAWAGTKVRILVSQPNDSDQTVPPASNGLALYNLASPVGAEVTLRTHALGHATPTWEPADWAATLQRWAPPLPPFTPSPTATATATATPRPTQSATPSQTATPSASPTPTSSPTPTAAADTTAPTVAMTSPADGATVSGIVTAAATASDAVGVTAVSFYAGAKYIGPGTLKNGLWTLTVQTKSSSTPNGVYQLSARATDAAGNIGASAPITVQIKN